MSGGTRRVYKFVSEEFGIRNLVHRRIKISRIADLNDPFEFLPTCRTAKERRVIREFKRQAHERIGLICFSASRSNPVLWSHYAEGHKGMCLGFDVPTAHIRRVTYSSTRTVANMQRLFANRESGEAEISRWLGIKYDHWSYEQEWRADVVLNESEKNEDGNWYQDFSCDLRLAEVVVGERSRRTRLDLNNALGELSSHVQLWKARLAFGEKYHVVRQRARAVWP